MPRAWSSWQDELRSELTGCTATAARVHGNLWLGNVLCSPEDGRVTGIVNWERSRTDLPVVDVMHLVCTTRALVEHRELGAVVRDDHRGRQGAGRRGRADRRHPRCHRSCRRGPSSCSCGCVMSMATRNARREPVRATCGSPITSTRSWSQYESSERCRGHRCGAIRIVDRHTPPPLRVWACACSAISWRHGAITCRSGCSSSPSRMPRASRPRRPARRSSTTARRSARGR